MAAAEFIKPLACLQEVQGKTLVVFVRDGEPAGVLVLMVRHHLRQLCACSTYDVQDESGVPLDVGKSFCL